MSIPYSTQRMNLKNYSALESTGIESSKCVEKIHCMEKRYSTEKWHICFETYTSTHATQEHTKRTDETIIRLHNSLLLR